MTDNPLVASDALFSIVGLYQLGSLGLAGHRVARLALGAGVALVLTGCNSPPERFTQQARRLEIVLDAVNADGFRLAVFRQGTTKPGGRIHLYLDGDGTPWMTRTQVARDPTSRNALILRLLAKDTAPALYLGRPCYHGEHRAPGCSPWLWTSGRYSEPVLGAMETALEKIIASESIAHVTLIGYSGGGVIAWHLAQRVAKVDAIVTVAANLDVRAWTQHHGYTPLEGSLNPADGPPMRPGVRQLHLVGRHDRNTPPALTMPLEARFGARFRRREVNAGHADGWLEHWPALISDLD